MAISFLCLVPLSYNEIYENEVFQSPIMMHDEKHLSKVLACPNCGFLQSITFCYGSITVDQKCIDCGKYAMFELPRPYVSAVNALKRSLGL